MSGKFLPTHGKKVQMVFCLDLLRILRIFGKFLPSFILNILNDW